MNVVSIDFDIIMAPSIEFYNHQVNFPDLFEHPLMKLCPADLMHYNRLTVWLLKEINRLTDEDIIFIQSHEQIVNYINDKNTFLINIDHHHDLGYIPQEDSLNCGNWAKHLLSNNLIKHYLWLKNESSVKPMFFNGNYSERCLTKYNLEELEADKIIICLSPQWIPPQYKHLFSLWLQMVNSTYGTDKKLIENK